MITQSFDDNLVLFCTRAILKVCVPLKSNAHTEILRHTIHPPGWETLTYIAFSELKLDRYSAKLNNYVLIFYSCNTLHLSLSFCWPAQSDTLTPHTEQINFYSPCSHHAKHKYQVPHYRSLIVWEIYSFFNQSIVYCTCQWDINNPKVFLQYIIYFGIWLLLKKIINGLIKSLRLKYFTRLSSCLPAIPVRSFLNSGWAGHCHGNSFATLPQANSIFLNFSWGELSVLCYSRVVPRPLDLESRWKTRARAAKWGSTKQPSRIHQKVSSKDERADYHHHL